jgi:hypothetical protein
MDLSYLGHVDETEQPAQFDVGSGFLVGFALGPRLVVSASSMKPAGSVHLPRRGSILRLHSSTRPSSITGRVPTTLSGFS